jgi:predicted ester cyclase
MSQPDNLTANKALIERIYHRGYNDGDVSVFQDCYSDGFVHHSKVVHDVAPGGQGEAESMRRFREAIPDVRFTVLHLLAEDDWVTARLFIAGTPVADYGSLQIAGGRFEQHALALFRIEQGRVAEEWLFTDAAG